jgi:pyridoxal phosphate enzyme (YggS family)
MSEVAANLAHVRARIAAACRAAGRDRGEVELVAVSKTHPAAAVRDALAAGQRAFGENRVQELIAKADELRERPGPDKDMTGRDMIGWHMIGSLQTNKVRELLRVPGLLLVHSLDRRALADELQRELARDGRTLAVLLQVRATSEESKHGCPPADAEALLAHLRERCARLLVQGVMAMGPAAGDPRPAFETAAALRQRLRAGTGLPLPVLSLGMSGDLEAAIAAGSTLVRVGTAVFGARAP